MDVNSCRLHFTVFTEAEGDTGDRGDIGMVALTGLVGMITSFDCAIESLEFTTFSIPEYA